MVATMCYQHFSAFHETSYGWLTRKHRSPVLRSISPETTNVGAALETSHIKPLFYKVLEGDETKRTWTSSAWHSNKVDGRASTHPTQSLRPCYRWLPSCLAAESSEVCFSCELLMERLVSYEVRTRLMAAAAWNVGTRLKHAGPLWLTALSNCRCAAVASASSQKSVVRG